MEPPFDHEKLDVYCLELQFVAWIGLFEDLFRPPVHRRRELFEQLDRASLSALPNTAEGNAKRHGRQMAKFFDDARGSAIEYAACLVGSEDRVEDDLERAGLPARPKDPKLLQRYQRFFNRVRGKFHYIEPTFRVDPSKSTHTNKGAKAGAGTETYDNWSGAVVYAPTGQSFKWVQGDWVVPNVYAPTENQWYYCANWIGIDGDGSGDVCQAGMICSVFESGGSTVRTIYPWHEWYPSSWVEITNLLINPGDLISMMICTAEGAGSTTATIYFGNQSSGLSMSYTITAPVVNGVQTKLVGNSAEWIVETPGINGVLTQMPDYGEVFFSTCEAYLTNGSVVNGGTGNNINLVLNAKTVSTGTLITPTVIQCQYTGASPASEVPVG